MTFQSMGCEVVVGGATESELARIRTLFEERDAVFSRFRPESELNSVNNGRGARLVSPLFSRMVAAALRAREQTGGLVDPTLGAAVEAAGYDRDFSLLQTSDEPPAPVGQPGRIELYGRVLVLEPGVRLDLNGVVKAAAVDEALRLVSGSGFVSAGGDLAASGRLDVALPGGGIVGLVAGGLATSGSTKRRWRRGGAEQHHLIDPVTGRPSTSRWDEVSVCGATCLAADVAAKAAFLLGDDGPDWLAERGLPGRFLERGRVYENSCWLAEDARVA